GPRARFPDTYVPTQFGQACPIAQQDPGRGGPSPAPAPASPAPRYSGPGHSALRSVSGRRAPAPVGALVAPPAPAGPDRTPLPQCGPTWFSPGHRPAPDIQAVSPARPSGYSGRPTARLVSHLASFP